MKMLVISDIASKSKYFRRLCKSGDVYNHCPNLALAQVYYSNNAQFTNKSYDLLIYDMHHVDPNSAFVSFVNEVLSNGDDVIIYCSDAEYLSHVNKVLEVQDVDTANITYVSTITRINEGIKKLRTRVELAR